MVPVKDWKNKTRLEAVMGMAMYQWDFVKKNFFSTGVDGQRQFDTAGCSARMAGMIEGWMDGTRDDSYHGWESLPFEFRTHLFTGCPPNINIAPDEAKCLLYQKPVDQVEWMEVSAELEQVIGQAAYRLLTYEEKMNCMKKGLISYRHLNREELENTREEIKPKISTILNDPELEHENVEMDSLDGMISQLRIWIIADFLSDPLRNTTNEQLEQLHAEIISWNPSELAAFACAIYSLPGSRYLRTRYAHFVLALYKSSLTGENRPWLPIRGSFQDEEYRADTEAKRSEAVQMRRLYIRLRAIVNIIHAIVMRRLPSLRSEFSLRRSRAASEASAARTPAVPFWKDSPAAAAASAAASPYIDVVSFTPTPSPHLSSAAAAAAAAMSPAAASPYIDVVNFAPTPSPHPAAAALSPSANSAASSPYIDVVSFTPPPPPPAHNSIEQYSNPAPSMNPTAHFTQPNLYPNTLMNPTNLQFPLPLPLSHSLFNHPNSSLFSNSYTLGGFNPPLHPFITPLFFSQLQPSMGNFLHPTQPNPRKRPASPRD